MPFKVLEFERLVDGDVAENDPYKNRYYRFGEQVEARITESRTSIHYIMSNISSFRAALGKGYRVRKLNNARLKNESLEELSGRVRLEKLQVVVIDAVSGFIEVSQEI